MYSTHKNTFHWLLKIAAVSTGPFVAPPSLGCRFGQLCQWWWDQFAAMSTMSGSPWAKHLRTCDRKGCVEIHTYFLYQDCIWHTLHSISVLQSLFVCNLKCQFWILFRVRRTGAKQIYWYWYWYIRNVLMSYISPENRTISPGSSIIYRATRRHKQGLFWISITKTLQV